MIRKISLEFPVCHTRQFYFNLDWLYDQNIFANLNAMKCFNIFLISSLLLLGLSSGIEENNEYDEFDIFGNLDDDTTTPRMIANTRSHQNMMTRTTTRTTTRALTSTKASQTSRPSTRSPVSLVSPVSQPDGSEDERDEVSSCYKCKL